MDTPHSELALRHNTGKAEYHQLYWPAVEQLVRVMMYGATKYAKDNWKRGAKYTTTIDSMTRHVVRLQMGEDIDQESGLPHYAHIMSNCMILAYNMAHFESLDDRDT